jgi:hypothetical protein
VTVANSVCWDGVLQQEPSILQCDLVISVLQECVVLEFRGRRIKGGHNHIQLGVLLSNQRGFVSNRLIVKRRNGNFIQGNILVYALPLF